MLKQLTVSNYALIDNIDISFDRGLTIITGETGAGKSILLGALSLLLGQRADAQAMRDKEKKCVVEGVFFVEGLGLEPFFEANELDYESNTVIRREISPSGKSRAFINDTPVSISQLKEIGDHVIDIHSQHQTLTLNTSNYQLSMLDCYAGNSEVMKEYVVVYRNYCGLKQQLIAAEEKEKQSKADIDYYTYLHTELEEANLKSGEKVLIEQELQALTHAEEIISGLSSISRTFDGVDVGYISQASALKSMMSQLVRFDSRFETLYSRFESTVIEIKDIASEYEDIASNFNYDPSRIAELTERLDKIYHLEQKHRVDGDDELLRIQGELSDKLLSISGLADDIDRIKNELLQLTINLGIIGEKLTKSRNDASVEFMSKVTSLLVELAMPDAQFKVVVDTEEEFNAFGCDKVKFLFSANKGGQPGELSKLASGGELSRLMLAIKSLVAERNLLPTIIFDEIDTGVSGNVAEKVGRILKNMATKMQVMAITHLPQIAAQGNQHYFVHKVSGEQSTHSSIMSLDQDGRVVEIAKMLSGEVVDEELKSILITKHCVKK